MADPEKFGEEQFEIKIERTHPIVTQAWTPAYKPAAHRMPAVWKSALAETAPEGAKKKTDFSLEFSAMSSPESRNLGGGTYNTSTYRKNANDNNNNNKSSSSPKLPGGNLYRPTPGATMATMAQSAALQRQGDTSGLLTTGFNAFAAAAQTRGGLNDRDNFGGAAGSAAFGRTKGRGGGNNNNGNGGGGMLLGGFSSRLDQAIDEEDEYDDRVDLMKSNMRGKAPLNYNGKQTPHHHSRRKTKSERENAREEYRKMREELMGGGGAGGYNSGGEVDEGCVGPLGDDDEYRAERLRFTHDAPFEDGTARTAYFNALQHHQRRGHNLSSSAMKTPGGGGKNNINPFDTTTSPGSSFKPQGLKTPVFDPASNLPGPVARNQRRQHHHLLRLLSTVPKNNIHDEQQQHGGVHLFPPHEIPTMEESEEKKKNPFSPEHWNLGDQTVNDVMKRHFLKK